MPRPVALAAFASLVLPAALAAQAPTFTMAQLKGYPFPTELAAAATGARVAWAFDEQGRRNVWVAEGPRFAARQLTRHAADDGQELTGVSVSADGKWVVYVRGGEHSGNWDDHVPVDPTSSPGGQKLQLWVAPFDGSAAPRVVADGGDEPALSPDGQRVAFVKDRAVWVAPLDGAQPARRWIATRGEPSDPRWSPDGRRLAFVSGRGDHAFVGVWSGDSTPVRWLAPSTSRDGSPRWSPDGARLAFVRRPGSGGAPDSLLVARHQPWGIWTADVTRCLASPTADEGCPAARLWQAPATLRGSPPSTHGGTNLHWTKAGRIAFASYQDGWPHLYSVPEAGGEATLLTPGNYMIEHVSMSPDGRALLASANTGPDARDIDRRHVLHVPVDRAAARVLTPGTGLEWMPVVTGDGAHVVYVSATPQRPPLPTAMPLRDGAPAGAPTLLAQDRIPADFPASRLVTPTQVVYDAPDGVKVHAQLFTPTTPAPAGGRRPAVVFVHGGPPRQMLLGWHYGDYYANTYAVNQYLASRGFVVLSVNYRLGIGYGYEFHRPSGTGAQGAGEYQDVEAAARWLRTRPDVDPARIGIWGGSYGGFLTAMALARHSDLFAAGVDVHGVHDWTQERARGMLDRSRFETPPDAMRALEVAWQSSPVASLAGWRSPVLLIHGDDDRNVRFNQTVDLARRLAAAGVRYEELVIPDDTHHFMRHANSVRVNSAVADFLERMLMPGRAAGRTATRER
ncbi:prolyl oligopeptidase family serine peptidase [Roseisolibacter sp. H3M3-2]|uniref:S9 family peptidase n=1 Tax=Roseisolibacter sp. H3M3-2 TaxID=3031323 RepID=UPI0023DA46F9|nr:prolyl oligopeptidase family serine peptidase [Roseisolibacter sp. H3M3-2]MDF1504742.1 prolyl oligopeptidase family serine peptidase [Roseisolibacter sp. H3M3-2]